MTEKFNNNGEIAKKTKNKLHFKTALLRLAGQSLKDGRIITTRPDKILRNPGEIVTKMDIKKIAELSKPEKPDIKELKEISVASEEPKVALPERYQRYLGKERFVPRADLEFFDTLLDRYGLADKTGEGQTSRKFGVDEFFAAAAEVQHYAVELRERIMPEWNEPLDSLSEAAGLNRQLLDAYAKMDMAHPANMRISDLSRIFLHHPKVKTAYMKIHEEKMTHAMPSFARELTELDTTGIKNRHEYFTRVQSLMGRNMREASSSLFTPEQIDTLGYLIGFEEASYSIPKSCRLAQFTNVGVGTFKRFLEKVVDEAVEEGEDIQSKIRREFLERDGVGHSAMRTHITDFVHKIEPDMYKTTLDDTREAIANGNFNKGVCPAIMKTESHTEPGEQRPIVYEYASIIVNNMPKHLLTTKE